jgi:hypothetical protein
VNSLEKLDQLMKGAGELVPETEEDARLIQMFSTARPFLGPLIPSTPEGLDAQLLGLAKWALALRSDDADPKPATEVLAEAFAEIRRRAGLDQEEPVAPGAPA